MAKTTRITLALTAAALLAIDIGTLFSAREKAQPANAPPVAASPIGQAFFHDNQERIAALHSGEAHPVHHPAGGTAARLSLPIVRSDA